MFQYIIYLDHFSADLLDHVMYKMGLLAVLRSKFKKGMNIE